MKEHRTMIAFNYRDCDAFAGYLHEQSLLGWHFKEFRVGMVFERREPADMDYAVEVFPKGTEMDTRPEKSTEEYAEYCEAAGWRLIDSYRKFCVFLRTKEDAVPIVEPEERFANIRRAEWLLWLSGAIPVFLIAGLFWLQRMTAMSDDRSFNNMMLLILLFITLSLAGRLSEGIYLLYWSVTRAGMLKNGEVPVYGKRKYWPFRNEMPLILFLLSVAFLAYSQDESFLPYVLPPIIVLIPLLLFTLWISCRRPSRSENWSLQLLAGAVIFFCFCGIIVLFLLY